MLRLDYGNARILLTGDLNSKSQELLLSYQAETEFTVDVAKACHHGSEDLDISFLRAMPGDRDLVRRQRGLLASAAGGDGSLGAVRP